MDFHHRGRFDVTITLHNGLIFGVVRRGPDLRRRPGTVLVLPPSVWEQRLAIEFCMDMIIDYCYVAVESREALDDRNSKG